jgi:hypothetical protein
MSDRTLSIFDLRALASIVDACDAGARVLWVADNGGTLDGVARHIVRDAQTFAFLDHDDDVREGFLRVSGTMEHALPIARVIELWHRGELTFSSDRR